MTIGDTQVLATVVGRKQANPGFFPLTVNYQEKTYAVGKTPAVSSSEKVGRQRKNFDLASD